MRAISKMMKSLKSTSKKGDLLLQTNQDYNAKSIAGMKKAIKFLEGRLNSLENIFSKAGSIEEISVMVDCIQNNTLSEGYLSTLNNIHSVSMAIKEILALYPPLIPASLFDHFLSPHADFTKLLERLSASNNHTYDVFEVLMKFLWKLVYYPQSNIEASFLARNIGIFILRSDKRELYASQTQSDIQTHARAFATLIDYFYPSEEDLKKYNPGFKPGSERASPTP
ncbi:hypothetical protein EON65_10275, partial [archaeon]